MDREGEIGVLGGGVVGLTIAYRLAKGGREVVLLDEGEPGQGTSYGNAGTVASYGIFPVATPSLWRKIPRLLFSSRSPLRVRWGDAWGMRGWYGRFLRETFRARFERNVSAIEGMVRGSVDDWKELVVELGCEELVNGDGFLYIFDDEFGRRDVFGDSAMRREKGIREERLGADGVRDLEPNLGRVALGGMYYPEAISFRDPGALMRSLARGCEREGVRILREKVMGIERGSGRVRVLTSGGDYRFGRVVLSMGAYSGLFARGLGDDIPLGVERGYHVEFDMEDALLSRPVCPVSRGFYMIPMSGRLRVAGTVELGKLDSKMSESRLRNLELGARDWLGSLPEVSREWLGYRPSFPDSVPVIGYSGSGEEVIYAFGHGHLGLTMAPKTASMVYDMVVGNGERDDWGVYGLGRFRV